MVKAIEVEMYKCPQCTEKHPTEKDARTCCFISEILMYECSECNKLYDEEQDAEECCDEESEEEDGI